MANVDVSDARVLRMHEVLLAIKLVKFYVWERSFAKQVEEVMRLVMNICAWVASVKMMHGAQLHFECIPSCAKHSNPSEVLVEQENSGC